MSRSQSHSRKLHREWLKQGAYAWQYRFTSRFNWRSGPVAFAPENLPREQASAMQERFRTLHPEIVNVWSDGARYRK